MPRYDFVCEKCGKVNEVIQPFEAEPPRCCDRAMARQVGNFALWYFKSLPKSEPVMHNSRALSAAATKGYQIAQEARS